MTNPANLTLPEILSQPQAWAEAVQVVEQQQSKLAALNLWNYDLLVFIGCGSTYYLSLSAAAVMQTLSGLNSIAVPSSEVLLSPRAVFPAGKRVALCAISRSGTTTETLQAVREFSSYGIGDVIVITNGLDTPLSQMGEVNLVIPAGFDHSVAQTRSFASMYLAAVAFACSVAQQNQLLESLKNMIPVGQKIIREYEGLAKKLGETREFKQFFFLGSGIRYGLACEASLKLKEMSLTVSEPFHAMEFRHGPISMVDSETVVVALLSEENYASERAVLEDVERLGGKTLTLGEQKATVCFNSGVTETVRGVLYLPVLQLLAFYRSLAFGLDADHPRNLNAVVKLSKI